MRFVSVNGINLAYYVTGHGTPLLMIQGLGGRAADWGSVPDRLAARFEVITFDNRGTGKSDKPDGEYQLEVMADEAVAVLQAAGFQRAHVVGLSMGGMIGNWWRCGIHTGCATWFCFRRHRVAALLFRRRQQR